MAKFANLKNQTRTAPWQHYDARTSIGQYTLPRCWGFPWMLFTVSGLYSHQYFTVLPLAPRHLAGLFATRARTWFA